MASNPSIDRFAVIAAGFQSDASTALAALNHSDSSLRASALRALHRLGELRAEHIAHSLTDQSPEVRRTAVELSVGFDISIYELLNDSDVFVAEMTAWSLGEHQHPSDEEIDALIHATTEHAESVVREACAAALGSLGDIRGLPAILSACADKPAVRRRAVLALAPFDGEQVDAALQRALEDRDWQVRQNAEILVNPRD
jgi:HEAT repeat protein